MDREKRLVLQGMLIINGALPFRRNIKMELEILNTNACFIYVSPSFPRFL